MKITYRDKDSDPQYPIMHGGTPMAKEFNKRQEKLWKDGKLTTVDFEQISTIILEVLCSDYDRRHSPRKKRKNVRST